MPIKSILTQDYLVVAQRHMDPELCSRLKDQSKRAEIKDRDYSDSMIYSVVSIVLSVFNQNAPEPKQGQQHAGEAQQHEGEEQKEAAEEQKEANPEKLPKTLSQRVLELPEELKTLQTALQRLLECRQQEAQDLDVLAEGIGALLPENLRKSLALFDESGCLQQIQEAAIKDALQRKVIEDLKEEYQIVDQFSIGAKGLYQLRHTGSFSNRIYPLFISNHLGFSSINNLELFITQLLRIEIQHIQKLAIDLIHTINLKPTEPDSQAALLAQDIPQADYQLA